MARGPVTFRQSDLTKALRAANLTRTPIASATIDSKTGNIVLQMGAPPPIGAAAVAASETK
jgi:hypothetical protein